MPYLEEQVQFLIQRTVTAINGDITGKEAEGGTDPRRPVESDES